MNNWQPLSQVKIPNNLLYWIEDNKSLTQKLKNKYPNFKVVVISEKLIKTPIEEKNILDEDEVICRKVNLCDSHTQLVYAKSLIPVNCHKLLNLGNRPLGEILFNQAKRGTIEVRNKNKTWSRRSIFTLNNHKILIFEFFMKNLYNTTDA